MWPRAAAADVIRPIAPQSVPAIAVKSLTGAAPTNA